MYKNNFKKRNPDKKHDLPAYNSTMTTTFAPDDKLHLTNLTKVFWPEQGYTKRDLLDYYRAIAPVILPHLIDRPQVLHRHVDGHAGKEFFQKVSSKCPPLSGLPIDQ